MKWLVILASLVLAQPADSQSPTPAPHTPRQEELSLRQLDVGQGDAALITTPEGKRILIDAGPDAYLVAGILRNEGIDTLDLVVASHAHADHIGGMPSVFQAVTVRAYMDNGVTHTTATYARTIAAAEREPGLQYLAAIDRTITLGSVRIRVLPPPRTHRTQNNNSVGLLIEYDRFRALYTGDSEQRELAHWLREDSIPPVTLVKAAHHGARNGVTAQWVEATAPEIVLVPVGSRNRYGHPSPQALRLWAAANSTVYRTDQMGEIEVKARKDGSYTVHTSNKRGVWQR
ncbi:MAG TPA: MBL fold metallo-hydrolase [Gemmatimonadaceae bacterium]|nr:MBL fold metallo-hydrolase [Gemmatimonadaceae bacterium]